MTLFTSITGIFMTKAFLANIKFLIPKLTCVSIIINLHCKDYTHIFQNTSAAPLWKQSAQRSQESPEIYKRTDNFIYSHFNRQLRYICIHLHRDYEGRCKTALYKLYHYQMITSIKTTSSPSPPQMKL